MPAPSSGDKQLYDYIEKAPECGLRGHRCTICGKTGNDRGNLRKHIENVHFPGIFSYQCRHCPPDSAVFPTRTKLYNHISTMHKNSRATCREGLDILTVVPFVMPAPYRRGQAAIRVYCEGSRGWIEGPQMHPLWSDWQRSEQPEETRGEHSLPWHFLLHLQILPA